MESSGPPISDPRAGFPPPLAQDQAASLPSADSPPAATPPVAKAPLSPPPAAPPPPIAPFPSHAPAPRGAPPPRRGRGWQVLALLLLVLLAVSVFGNLRHLAREWFSVDATSAEESGPELREALLENNHADSKIVVIDVSGIIFGGYFDGGDINPVDSIEHQLKRAAKDREVKGVILRINSPGGEVLAADAIYRLVADFQKKHRKPVVAAMEGVAASGGYYVAAPCRWIVANGLTITGSIGVIMHGYNYRGLMDKVGVRPEVYKSGKFKDMMSGDRADKDIPIEEAQMLQALIDETFARFKEVVREGRGSAQQSNQGAGRKLVENWSDYADGRVFSGRQAHELGFVDELGDFKVAVARAKSLAKVDRANLVQYHHPFDLFNLFRLFGQTKARTVKLDVGLDLPRLEPGRLYYLFLPGAR